MIAAVLAVCALAGAVVGATLFIHNDLRGIWIELSLLREHTVGLRIDEARKRAARRRCRDRVLAARGVKRPPQSCDDH